MAVDVCGNEVVKQRSNHWIGDVVIKSHDSKVEMTDGEECQLGFGWVLYPPSNILIIIFSCLQLGSISNI